MGVIVLLIILAVAAGVFIANGTLSTEDRRRPRRRGPAPPAIIAPSGPASASSDADFALLLHHLNDRWRRDAPESHVPYPSDSPAPHEPAPSHQQADRATDAGGYADHGEQPSLDYGGDSSACDTGSDASFDSGDCGSGGGSFD